MSALGEAVLVIAAHPDDETLGCGGTLARHAAAGEPVTIVVVCDNDLGRRGPYGAYDPAQLRAAAKRLGVEDVRHLCFADQALDTHRLTELIEPLAAISKEVLPRVVYIHHGGDINRDHQITFQAALVATRPTERSIEAVYAFDTASSTEWGYPRSFVPDTWVDVAPTLALKLDAMECYRSELRDYPHPRSREALEHRARALGNQVCLDAAEAFMTVRRVVRHGQTVV